MEKNYGNFISLFFFSPSRTKDRFFFFLLPVTRSFYACVQGLESKAGEKIVDPTTTLEQRNLNAGFSVFFVRSIHYIVPLPSSFIIY